jgi:hypothetical protein
MELLVEGIHSAGSLSPRLCTLVARTNANMVMSARSFIKFFRFDALHVHAPDCQASRAVTMLATLTAAIDRLTAPVKSDGLNPAVRSGATFIVAS